MFRYLFKRDTLLATVAVFVVMGLLSLLPINTHVLDPIRFALQDFDYNDLAYSKMAKNRETALDTNVVIVNIGKAGRPEIAALIQKIDQHRPAVIGVDVLFAGPKSRPEDSLLQALVATNPRVVLAYNLEAEGAQLVPRGFLYAGAAQKGFANFVGEEGGVIRHFAPAMVSGSQSHSYFAAAVVKVADPARYEALVDRQEAAETIHYTRTPDKYIVVEGQDLLDSTESGASLAGKVVLLGFVSAESTNVEDKHFTPLNKNSFGRSLPDMEGVFVHANVVSMILEGNYIRKMPAWLTWSLAFLLCWLHMSLFIRYYLDRHLWFHLVAKSAQLLSAIAFVYLGLLFFNEFNAKINLTPTLVAIILAVDVLYFYEALCAWLHKKVHYRSLFSHSKPH